MPANEYYDPTGVPADHDDKLSEDMRNEFNLIEAGFNKIPALTGNGGKIIRVNAGETALEVVNPAPLLAAEGVESSTLKDTINGYLALDGYKPKLHSLLNTFISTLANSSTAARTYTLQDRDGTLLTAADLVIRALKASPNLTGTPTVPTPAVSSGSTAIANCEWLQKALGGTLVNPGYIEFFDHYLLQFGNINCPLLGESYTDDFAIPFDVVPFMFNASVRSNHLCAITVTGISTTSISVSTSFDNVDVGWFAFGHR